MTLLIRDGNYVRPATQEDINNLSMIAAQYQRVCGVMRQLEDEHTKLRQHMGLDPMPEESLNRFVA